MALLEEHGTPQNTRDTALSIDHDDVSATFNRMPNELKLMFAGELGIHDVNALARTCREMNELLARLMYCRAKDSRTKRGRPYFLLAVDNGNLAAVERFIEFGASVNMKDKVTYLQETAIHSCAHLGHVEIAKLLIHKGVNVLAVDRFGRGALHSVGMGMHPKEAMVTLLVEAGVDVKAPWGWDTPLHLAAMNRNVRTVQRLLELGADPNAADNKGSRPVHVAAAESNAAIVRYLLEAGKNIEIADNYGRTPLHDTVEYGTTESVKVLLEMGADVSSLDFAGSTPLLDALRVHGNEASVHRIIHLAASTVDQIHEKFADCVPSCQLQQPNHIKIEMLLAAGADIMKPHFNGVSPLKWATVRAYTTTFRR